MRSNFKDLADGKFHNFYGTFITQRDTKDPCISRSSVALIKGIKNNENQFITDHIWISFPGNKKIKKGTIIYFKAKVDTYVKGYLGFNTKQHSKSKIELDYQLTNVTILESNP